MENMQKNTTVEASGSITVYQRFPEGAKPHNVQVLKSLYKSIKGSDGETYHKTKNVPLIVIPSGTPALGEREADTLRKLGLTEPQLAHVNSRLFELAERARPYILAGQKNEAEVGIKAAVAIGADVPSARNFVLQKLREAVLVLDDESILGQPAKASCGTGEVSSRKSLLNILQTLNTACTKAQEAYRNLPKGQEASDELVLEFQKAWFSTQDMFNTLKGRECFYRPSGWSELRNQVLSGQRFRKGDKIPVRKRPSR